jgi:hypothetical protein
LWLWALGLTDQFLSYKITLKAYNSLSQELQKEVTRLNLGLHEKVYKGDGEFAYISSGGRKKFGGITFETRSAKKPESILA